MYPTAYSCPFIWLNADATELNAELECFCKEC